ncbi:MAG: ABC transporter ATP-binding protein, partial [Myxococcota bacterium]
MSLLFSDITHAYATTPVLSDLNLEVKTGEIACLLGPSGGGKSTLLRLAAGLERLQAGRIEIDGDVYATPEKMESPERRPVGMMFQDSALFPHLSVAENVAFGLHGWSKDKSQSRVAELLEWVGCAELGRRMPHQLSGGQQQRIALIRSLAPEPRALLMDEPYASVDITLRRTLREVARGVLKGARTTTLMVTHDPNEAIEMADRIAVLDEGTIAQEGTPKELYESPRGATVAALFGDAQRLKVRVTSDGFQTDFGLIQDANPKSDATELVIRPSGVSISTAAQGSAVVSDIRYVGDGVLAFLLPVGSAQRVAPLRVSVSEGEGIELGSTVALKRRGHGF